MVFTSQLICAVNNNRPYIVLLLVHLSEKRDSFHYAVTGKINSDLGLAHTNFYVDALQHVPVCVCVCVSTHSYLEASVIKHAAACVGVSAC